MAKPRNPADYDIIFRKSFWHKWAKKLIVAPPGKVFVLYIRKK